MKLRSILLLSLLAASASFADAPPAGGPPGMPSNMTMFRAGGIGTIGYIAYDLPTIGIAYLPIDHVMVAAALSLQYNANGDGVFLGAPNARTFVPAGQTWEAGLLLAVEYMIKDTMPFAMGPAFAARFSFTGDPMSTVILMPAWDLWYTPFNAPIAIGTALGMSITLQKGRDPYISLMTPALRLAYTF